MCYFIYNINFYPFHLYTFYLFIYFISDYFISCNLQLPRQNQQLMVIFTKQNHVLLKYSLKISTKSS